MLMKSCQNYTCVCMGSSTINPPFHIKTIVRLFRNLAKFVIKKPEKPGSKIGLAGNVVTLRGSKNLRFSFQKLCCPEGFWHHLTPPPSFSTNCSFLSLVLLYFPSSVAVQMWYGKHQLNVLYLLVPLS